MLSLGIAALVLSTWLFWQRYTYLSSAGDLSNATSGLMTAVKFNASSM